MSRPPKEPFELEDGRDDLPFQIHFELDDAPLSVWAFRVYAHLVRRAGRDGLIYPSYQTIAEKCFRPTYGPNANPRSLRNKAMAAVKELVEAGLLIKQERRTSARENTSNLYTLTPRRQWVEDLQRRRAELEAQTEAARDARRSGGGIPTMPPPGTPGMPPGIPTMPPPGTPGMPPGTPTMPEVTSTEVPQEIEVLQKEVVLETLNVSARAGATADSSTLPEGGSTTTTGKENDEQPPSPDGEATASAVGAATASAVSGSDSAPVGVNVQATSTEKVPAGPGGLAALRPVAAAELARRADAAPGSVVYRAVAAMVGAHKKKPLEGILEQPTPTGGLPRLWLRLTEDEVVRVRTAAQQEIAGTSENFFTAAIRGLDKMIGAPIHQPKAPAVGGANGISTALATEAAPPPPVEVGSTWYGRKSGKAYKVVDVYGSDITVEGLPGNYNVTRFHANFTSQAPERSGAA